MLKDLKILPKVSLLTISFSYPWNYQERVVIFLKHWKGKQHTLKVCNKKKSNSTLKSLKNMMLNMKYTI